MPLNILPSTKQPSATKNQPAQKVSSARLRGTDPALELPRTRASWDLVLAVAGAREFGPLVTPFLPPSLLFQLRKVLTSVAVGQMFLVPHPHPLGTHRCRGY